MQSSVSGDSTLGVIVFVLNGVAAETWAHNKKMYQGQPWCSEHVLSCLCQTVGTEGGKGSYCSVFNTSDNKNIEQVTRGGTFMVVDITFA